MARKATTRRLRKTTNEPGFFENAVEIGVRFTFLFTILWSSSETLSTFGGLRKPRDVPNFYDAPRADQVESHTMREAPQRCDPHQACNNAGSAPRPQVLVELPTRLRDGKESTLSPVALQLQQEARTKLHERHARLNEQNKLLVIDSATQAQARKVAQMDRESLAVLEAATARSAILMQRSRPATASVTQSQCPTSEALHTPDHDLQASEPNPSSHLNARILAQRSPRSLPRTYSGTSPYDSPSSRTGSSRNIHSLKDSTVDSDLFRSDCRKLFHAPLEAAGAPLDVHEATKFLERLHKARQMDPATKKIHDWMEGEIESAARGALGRSGGKVHLEASQALFEEVLGLAENVEEGGGMMDRVLSGSEGADGESQHSGSVWSWEGVDSGSVTGEDTRTGVSAGEEYEESIARDDDCEWLDLEANVQL